MLRNGTSRISFKVMQAKHCSFISPFISGFSNAWACQWSAKWTPFIGVNVHFITSFQGSEKESAHKYTKACSFRFSPRLCVAAVMNLNNTFRTKVDWPDQGEEALRRDAEINSNKEKQEKENSTSRY